MTPEENAADAAPTEAAPVSAASTGVAPTRSAEASASSKEGGETAKPASQQEPAAAKGGVSASGATGYVGKGRYRQKSGEEKERITPYVRPDQARALRVAAAPGDDPRGSDISAIVRTLLDEAGLCDPVQRGSE